MLRYTLKRLFQTIIVLFGVTLVTFIMVNVVPGDPAAVMLQKKADEATIERIRDQMGLNDPLPAQYLRFVKNAVTGDFGNSYFQKKPVITLIAKAFSITGSRAVWVLLFSVLLGVMMGTLAAVCHGKLADRLIMLVSTLGMAAPSFWIAIVLQLIFGLTLKWLPISGLRQPTAYIMPSVSLGLIYAASIARLTRTNILDAMNQNYIRTARAKGVGEFSVVMKHAFKNAAIPILTYLGTLIKSVLGGSVLVETIFSINGLGKLLVEAIMKRDIPIIQGCTVYIASIFVLCNLLIDLVYGLIDPRIRVANARKE